MEIASDLPFTAKKLKAVKGMGGKKMEQTGQDLLALIMQYRSEKGMDIPFNARQEIELAGMDTREVSLCLLREGLTPDQISKKRDLAVSTIEGHLAYFVGKGMLDIFQVINKRKYDLIRQELLKKTESETLGTLKNKLGPDFSYGEIRLVMADIGME